MKKLLLYFTLICVILLHPLKTYCEEETKSRVFDKKNMEAVEEALSSLWDSFLEVKKEQGKYQPPYYSYDKSFVEGIAYVSEKLATGNIIILYYFKNNSKTSFDVSKAGYFGVDGSGNIFKFEFGGVLFNQGIQDSSLVNPQQEIQVGCIMPFTEYYQAKGLKEVYLKIRGKRIYFVPEELVEEYSKPRNKFSRKARDFFRNFF